ncbi:MAG: transposase [Thermoanaerobaculia bacterium]|nr:MAG: transposase [Thermoanaerobaculia bacterium]MBZ0102674.1 transposase [Thermoanaerobaculia bacterium]
MSDGDLQRLASEFVAIDVETANADLASICQVGIAVFRGGCLAETFCTLIDPGDYFDPVNVSIHGIDAGRVRGAPRWAEVSEQIRPLLAERVVAHHTAFDRAAFRRAAETCGTGEISCRWLDTARVVRRAWPAQFGARGYGLGNVTKELGIEFRHHDALEDARAAGEVLLRAIQDTGIELLAWFQRVEQSIHGGSSGRDSIVRDGPDDGPLHGEVVVFTGRLSIPRAEAADLAAAVGCDVAAGVTKDTTLLVVGDQDILRLSGEAKSSKHRKAEALILRGQQLRIVGESDFRRIVALQGI